MTSRYFKHFYYDECDWAQFPGDETIFVSNTGIVISKKRGFEYELTQTATNNGYLQCNIGAKSITHVHKMVALCWVPNAYPDIKVEINHRDGDKQNNVAWNLEWVTHLENIRHSIDMGLKGPSPQSIPIRIVETGEIFDSISSCAKAINGNDRDIGMCLIGRRNMHKNLHFEYLERN